MVVRFNGGAQAGHTVCTHDGLRHVFQHVGSGAFLGVPTFLSQFFVVNPILFFKELTELNKIGIYPIVYAHPQCLVTTFADMIINQRKEDDRGLRRHGSCGVGFNETIERSRIPELTITMSDLWNNTQTLNDKLERICNKYAVFRTGSPINEPAMTQAFIKGCWALANHVHPLGIGQCVDPVFEGAQGLLLDQENTEYFPHLTRSNTGMKNVRILCAQAGITDIDTYYVSRTYLTRHGAGPLPGEDDRLSYIDDTNTPHAYQGKLRFAKLDYSRMLRRCFKDFGTEKFSIALTHLDQCPPMKMFDGVGINELGNLRLYSYGPTRDDVSVHDGKRNG